MGKGVRHSSNPGEVLGLSLIRGGGFSFRGGGFSLLM